MKYKKVIITLTLILLFALVYLVVTEQAPDAVIRVTVLKICIGGLAGLVWFIWRKK